jgi:general secretion pathway protein B
MIFRALAVDADAGNLPMSFILDALKKSEAERQQKNAPGIANIPESVGQRTSSKWVWIIGVLLVANLAGLGYIVLKPGPTESPVKPEQAITAEPADSAAETPVEATSAQPSQAAVQSSPPPVETAPEEPQSQPVIREPEPETASLPTVAVGLASFNELRARGVLQLPDLHLDIHVYSGTPAERFVFVNMSKYTENTTLDEGPTVREITPDGVILDYLGTAFLLPRE